MHQNYVKKTTVKNNPLHHFANLNKISSYCGCQRLILQNLRLNEMTPLICKTINHTVWSLFSSRSSVLVSKPSHTNFIRNTNEICLMWGHLPEVIPRKCFISKIETEYRTFLEQKQTLSTFLNKIFIVLAVPKKSL